MSATSIQWCDHSINPIRAMRRGYEDDGATPDPDRDRVGHYCEKISRGCANCYSSALQRRFGMPQFNEQRGLDGIEPFLDHGKLREVLRRRKPTRFFWCDMSDLFGAWVPNDWIDRCFATMALTPQHTHLVLTKRPERMREYLGGGIDRVREIARRMPLPPVDDPKGVGSSWPLPNVHVGISAEDQDALRERLGPLCETPAAIRFLSLEPLLGPIDFAAVGGIGRLGWGFRNSPPVPGIDWVIVGGESGPRARPCDVSWIRSIVEQCQAAGVPCFTKQLGAHPYEKRPADGGVHGVDEALANLGAEHPQRPWFGNNWTLVSHGDETEWFRYLKLRDRKGGDPEEWPSDLRVREFPAPRDGEWGSR